MKADHANGFDHGLDVGDDVHGLLAYARSVSDPALGIDWPEIEGEPTLSEKDLEAPLLADFDTPFTYKG